MSQGQNHTPAADFPIALKGGQSACGETSQDQEEEGTEKWPVMHTEEDVLYRSKSARFD